jgi:hypothetical protein
MDVKGPTVHATEEEKEDKKPLKSTIKEETEAYFEEDASNVNHLKTNKKEAPSILKEILADPTTKPVKP